jgi:hypothetical protein
MGAQPHSIPYIFVAATEAIRRAMIFIVKKF